MPSSSTILSGDVAEAEIEGCVGVWYAAVGATRALSGWSGCVIIGSYGTTAHPRG